MALFDNVKTLAATIAAPIAPTSGLGEFMQSPEGDIAALMGITLMPHQQDVVKAVKAGYRSLLIADEMGVGKTASAIGSIEETGSYPAVIVCPPSLTTNWVREWERAVPNRTVAVLSGTKPGALPTADVYVIGDSVVFNWVMIPNPNRPRHYMVGGPLSTLHPMALVMDECHRAKNEDSQRSRAVLALSTTVQVDGLRLMLSGTPMLAKPTELIAPLKAIGVLNTVFGGKARFLSDYVQYEYTAFGAKPVGGRNLQRLAQEMRRVMIRRLRSEVLTLPNKGRNVVRVAMSAAAQRRYERAEENLVDFLRGDKGNRDYTLNERAEALVLLNTLRRVAGEGKIEAAIQQAQDLLDEGEQVFIACWHKDVADRIWQGLHKHGVVQIVGGMTAAEKQAAVDAFQSGSARVCVGNIIAAGTGFTLTSGRHIIVAELPWSPADLQQVEDRLHRIGQTRDVFSTVLMADWKNGSVDERLWSLLDSKAQVCNAVLDNKDEGLQVDGESVANALLDSYR